MQSKIGIGEGENVFGSESKAGIAISILVYNPNAKEQGKIYFHDIGDDLKTNKKLEKIAEFESINGITNSGNGWDDIQPDKYNDWINQRDPSFENHISIGTKKDKLASTMFQNYSLGINTNRDQWVYNASKKKLENNISSMIDVYNEEVAKQRDYKKVIKDPKKIKWSSSLESKFKRGLTTEFSQDYFRIAMYRPFEKRNLYFDPFLIHRPGQMPQIFPHKASANRVISMCGVGKQWIFCFNDGLHA